MIKNSKEILSHSVRKTEKILKEFIINVGDEETQGNLNVNNMENLLGIMFKQFQDMGLAMAGELFSNLV